MIARVFLWLFWACRHEWEIIDKCKASRKIDGEDRYVGDEYTLRCKKCGKMKTWKGY